MVEDVTPKQVWEALGSHKQARLVDVRTDYEWTTIGVPNLSGIGSEPILASWQLAPAMQFNPAFLDDLRAGGVTESDHLYFLCRSGVRSVAAGPGSRGGRVSQACLQHRQRVRGAA